MKQNFRQGDKVNLIHMNEQATVTRIANGMIYVNLDGDEIPVYPEDIALAVGGSSSVERSDFKPRTDERPKEKVPVSLLVLNERGLLLIMEPFIDQEKNLRSRFIFKTVFSLRCITISFLIFLMA